MIIISILLFALFGAVFFKKNLEQLLPMAVALVAFITYLLGITNHLSRALVGSCVVLILCAGVFCALYMLVYKKTLRQCLQNMAKTLTSPGLYIYLSACVFICIIFSNHFVTNWDDFNYWANFPKNIYLKDAFLSGGELCTAYKDYLPIIQLLYYLAFKTFGGFNEGVMFAVNNIVLLTFLVPYFEYNGDRSKPKYVTKVFSGLLFVAAFSFQSIHCLGVDIIIAVVFGYLLYQIFFAKRDLFFYLNIVCILSFLIMIKSAAIFIFVVTVVVYAICEYNNGHRLYIPIISAVIPVAFYFSWNVFCRVHGNVSYLSKRLDVSVSEKSFLHFPKYSAVVLGRFFKEFSLMNLNGGLIGASALFCVIFSAIVLCWFNKKNNKKMSISLIVLLIGAVFYLAFLLYTYLFVFEEWEALSLSSFDRYISLYALGPVYVSCMILVEEYDFNKRAGFFYLPLFMFLTLNFGFLYSELIPERYAEKYESINNGRAKVREQIDKIYADNPTMPGKRLLIINLVKDDELEKYQQYEFIPSVNYILHLDEIEGQNIEECIEEQLSDHSLDAAIDYDKCEVVMQK